MVFIETLQETYLHKRWNTQQVRHVDVFECDECGSRFTLGHKAAHATNGALTFCSKECRRKSRSSGKLAKKCIDVRLELYGVEYSSQVPGASEKMIESRIRSTGAASPSDASSSSNARFKQTMLERHGAEMPSLSESVQAKKVETYRARYGVDNPFSAGSPFRLSTEELSIAGQKGYRATARLENGWILSRPELALVEFLREWFGEVDQQVPIEHGTGKPWLIDAYVRRIDTYVQLDGEFWHGLDKPYSELHSNGKASYDADRRQDDWFRSRCHRLVRVTDKELEACQRSGDWSDIVARLGG